MKRTQMRDTIKDIKYFNTFINEEQARVKKFSDKLKNGEVKEDRIFPVKSKMHDLKLGILIAGYSKGDELSILEKEYQGLIDDWEEVWEPEYYNKNLTYTNCEVDEDWLNFQNFAKWYKENYYEIEGEQMELDKDILYKHNKL